MADALPVDEFHARDDLANEVFDLWHWNQLSLVLCGLDDFLKVLIAEFEDQVLNDLVILVF